MDRAVGFKTNFCTCKPRVDKQPFPTAGGDNWSTTGAHANTISLDLKVNLYKNKTWILKA